MLNKKLLALAIIFSLFAAGSVYWFLSTTASKIASKDSVSVVTAAVDIPKNTVIKEEMLSRTQIPQSHAQSGVIAENADAVGKVTDAKIFSGQQVLDKALIAPGDKKAGLSLTIPKGRRAVTVAVNEVSGLNSLLMPGDRVDVAATLDFKGTVDGGEINQTSVILQNIQVLAVGKALEAEAQTWAQKEESETTATLAVTPQEAQPLIMASERGTIRMLLRSPADEEVLKVPALRGTDMLQGR